MTDRRIPVEELIDFPTSFAFKAIGHHTLGFQHEAVEATRSALPGDRRIQYRTRLSRNGTYLSVTVTATVVSADELRSVYDALWHVGGVITVL
jgi:putative lipoic acid-binding regulatory protein